MRFEEGGIGFLSFLMRGLIAIVVILFILTGIAVYFLIKGGESPSPQIAQEKVQSYHPVPYRRSVEKLMKVSSELREEIKKIK